MAPGNCYMFGSRLRPGHALGWFCEEGVYGILLVVWVWLARWLGLFSSLSVFSSPCIVVAQETVTVES